MGDYYRYYYQKSLSYWKSVLGKYLLLALLLGIFWAADTDCCQEDAGSKKDAPSPCKVFICGVFIRTKKSANAEFTVLFLK